uniref:AT-rich interactive domain-containing protein 3 n=1 Tax=Periophthalmus magnuspinnatus TaxID=409849 RepID=A0A3B4B6R8_9GOBI
MKLQAVMENLHRQQRAKLLMEQQLQQGQGQVPGQVQLRAGLGDEPMVSPARDAEHTQMAALAAMRAAAAGLQRVSDSPMSERSSGDDDEEEEGDQYKDMMGSDEEEHIKQKWDEDDFEGEMEDDFDDDLAEEGLPTAQEAVTPGKGILLLPHRHHLGLYELDSDPKRKEFLDDLFSFMQKRGTPVNRIPIMAKQVLDLYMLYRLVTEKGGLVEVINKKLWREITKGLNLPTSITSAAFTLRTQYMKYLYPYECDKRGLSNPNELQAAIDSNRREGRRQSFGTSLFTYSPNGTPTMLSSSKIPAPGVGMSMGMSMGTNGATLTPIQKIKKEEGGQPLPGVGMARLSAGALAGHSVAAVQAAQAAMAAQVAALEHLRDKLETGEPPEKKMAVPAEEHHRLLQRALQHNLLAMSQLPMNIRINNQSTESAVNLTTNGSSSISMSVELNGVMYTGLYQDIRIISLPLSSALSLLCHSFSISTPLS